VGVGQSTAIDSSQPYLINILARVSKDVSPKTFLLGNKYHALQWAIATDAFVLARDAAATRSWGLLKNRKALIRNCGDCF